MDERKKTPSGWEPDGTDASDGECPERGHKLASQKGLSQGCEPCWHAAMDRDGSED